MLGKNATNYSGTLILHQEDAPFYRRLLSTATTTRTEHSTSSTEMVYVTIAEQRGRTILTFSLIADLLKIFGTKQSVIIISIQLPIFLLTLITSSTFWTRV
jgi:hypothetical protein